MAAVLPSDNMVAITSSSPLGFDREIRPIRPPDPLGFDREIRPIRPPDPLGFD